MTKRQTPGAVYQEAVERLERHEAKITARFDALGQKPAALRAQIGDLEKRLANAIKEGKTGEAVALERDLIEKKKDLPLLAGVVEKMCVPSDAEKVERKVLIDAVFTAGEAVMADFVEKHQDLLEKQVPKVKTAYLALLSALGENQSAAADFAYGLREFVLKNMEAPYPTRTVLPGYFPKLLEIGERDIRQAIGCFPNWAGFLQDRRD